MNASWRERHTKAHARYGNLKDRIDRTSVDAPEWERLERELDAAEAELKALDREWRAALGAD